MKIFRIPIPRIRRARTRKPAPGARPGTLQVRPELPPATITRIEYSPAGVTAQPVPLAELETAFAPRPDHVVWVDVTGLGDAEVLQRIGTALALHPLTVEDIAHVHQRPKLEEVDGYLFATLRAIRVDESGNVGNEQLSILLNDGLLVTFQERPGDGFEPIRRRLRDGKGPLLQHGADYLFYALLDVTIDDYFPVLELYGDTMDQLDDQIRARPTPGLARMVHTLRRELRQLRRAAWPLRDVVAALTRNEVARVDASLRPAFRDCHDHAVQVAEFVEGSRERAADLGDLYQTMVSERTNQVMKTLTIVSTIFIPLTFLCGLYGMNFDSAVSPYNMPELKWRYGYLLIVAIMLVTVGGMVWLFRRKGWLGSEVAVDTASSQE
jgi:magnesium transporter